MEKLTLDVSARTVFGKKLKSLRKQGIVPANIYGKGVVSTSVQADSKELLKVAKVSGETSLIELNLAKEKRPVLIHHLQKEPVSGEILHVDFHQVDLKEKTTAEVPIKVVGEAEIVKSGVGLILQTLNDLEVEALPADIPHEIEIDVSKLTELGQSVLVKDLKVGDKVAVLTDPEVTVLTLKEAEMKEEVGEEAPALEEVEVIGEKKEGEGEEKTEEGEVKGEEGQEEGKE